MSFFVRLLFGPKKISFFSFFFNKQVGERAIVGSLSLLKKNDKTTPLSFRARAHAKQREEKREREKKRERHGVHGRRPGGEHRDVED